MAIVSSVYVSESIGNGRYLMQETHTDQNGKTYTQRSIYTEGIDPDQFIQTRAANLAESLAQQELDEVLM